MQEMARRRKKIPESEFKEGPQGLKVRRGRYEAGRGSLLEDKGQDHCVVAYRYATTHGEQTMQ
jgi:hypothetical protein